MHGGADGLFTLLRPDDELHRHTLMVVCDLCHTGASFDERLAKPSVEEKIRQITRRHVCSTSDEVAKAMAAAMPKKKKRQERTWSRVDEVVYGKREDRIARSSWPDDED